MSDRSSSPAPVDASALAPSMADAAEMLWVVLANVSGGDWTQQSAEWREAAARWRDNYFAAVKALAAPRAPLEPREETPPDKQLREGDARYLRGLVRAHRLHGGPLLQPTNIEVLERVLWRAGLYSGPVTITEAARPRPALPQGPTFTLRGYRLRCPKCHHEWDSIFPATGWEGARCQQCGWQFGEPDYPIEVAHPALGPQE
jgi:hypothetical protein